MKIIDPETYKPRMEEVEKKAHAWRLATSDEFDKYEIGFEEGATWADEPQLKNLENG